jgi:mitochondrial GTPase 1
MNRLTRPGQAGIKEGLYDNEALAAYLLYRLNALNQTGTDVMYPNSITGLIDFSVPCIFAPLSFWPKEPSYLTLFLPGTAPTDDVHEFLGLLARRLGMIQRGGVPDLPRAAGWFVRWWRDKGGATSSRRSGWGLDFEWSADADADANANASDTIVQSHMEKCIDRFVAEEARDEEEGGGVSTTQERKRIREESRAKRALVAKARRRRRT